ncbi:MAG: biosynthetic-type acetolactate synthase large subunit [Lentisphaeria bacterium]|nr:biosynthetic-type acetolactate synthase large subunit [Lentisphaeria bacterium]NLZ59312.1 biosynthetic-type acetolactate synthase large subunit [Lentisphaerota bacterium]
MNINGAEMVIRILIEEGVDTVFGYPGGAVLDIYDELYKHSEQINHITPCHEQGASHAADAFARVSGKVGVVISTSGPGATNLVTGIANAYLDSSPMVAITGNVPCSSIGKDSFQEVDITGVTMPITKHNFIVKDAANLADTLREAFAIARQGRPGPVLVDIPKDIQKATCVYLPKKPRYPVYRNENGKEAFAEAVKLIKACKRPFIYSGGGTLVSNATEELLALAERVDAPIGSSMMGLSAVRHDHPRFLGMTGMHGRYAATQAMAQADLLIAVGTRFSDRATGNKIEFIKGKKVIHIDIDPSEIGKNIPAFVSLIGDVKTVLAKLVEELPGMRRAGWNQELAAIRNSPDSRLKMPEDSLNPETAIRAVNRMADPQTVVCTDVGQHQMWVAQYYNFSRPRGFITSGGLGTMGFGLGASLGACLADGRKKTLLFTSDGSFHMNMNEMATAVSQQLPIIIVLMNNNTLGMVRQWQTLFFDKRYAHTSLERQTNYIKLAEAFGLEARQVSELPDLQPALEQAFAAKGPFLLELIIDQDDKVLPMIPPGGTINDIILKA